MAKTVTQYRVDVHVPGEVPAWKHGPSFMEMPSDEQVNQIYWNNAGIRTKGGVKPDKVRIVKEIFEVVAVRTMT